MSTQREVSFVAGESWKLRAGAALVSIGSLAVLGFGAAHGALPEDESGQEVVRYVAEYTQYAAIHFGSIVGVVLWVIGVSTLPATVTSPVASSVARFGATAALVGAAVFAVHYSADGFGFSALGNRWADAAPEDRASIARDAELVETLLEGPGFAWVVFLWGLPIVLLGLALVLDGRYPTWLGAAGVILGVASFAAGAVQFLDRDLLSDDPAFAIPTLGAGLWGFALGLVMWRQSQTMSAPEQPS